MFAMVSLPRRAADRKAGAILLSFGLEHPLASPRIWQATEPYPRRWTHHVPVYGKEELDDELFGWLEEAWQFAMVK